MSATLIVLLCSGGATEIMPQFTLVLKYEILYSRILEQLVIVVT